MLKKYWDGVLYKHGGGAGMGGEGWREPTASLIMRKDCQEDLTHGMSNIRSGNPSSGSTSRQPYS